MSGSSERYAEVERALLARWPESRLDPTLDRVRSLVELLGDPQASAPVIHVTGTNGKTSTARMIDSLLRAFGLRTGRFTSPHVESMRERISLDGEPIDEERFVRAYEDVAPYVELVDARGGPPMSFFEVITGMAYAAFADAPVDVMVVEVGMGGTWDATNVADGQVAVVTPIALDHAAYLGPTVGDIAGEKAGIIKAGADAVIGQQPVEAGAVLASRAGEVGARASREGIDFGVLSREVAVGGQLLALRGLGGDYDELVLPLHGAHQAHNAACALAAVEAFLGAGPEAAGGGTTPGARGRIDVEAVQRGFADATSPGRLEVFRRSPTILLDAAHNPAGAEATAAALEDSFGFTRLIGVIGAMADKDVEGVLSAFERVLAEVVVTQSASPRAMDVDDLAAIAVDVFGEDRVEIVPRLDEALDVAVSLAEQEGDLGGSGVLVTGSVVTVGEARVLLGRRRRP